ncbi:MAG: M20/M25/M40 family metallo-hydrolase [Gemmatimonadota bacterium]
MAQSDSRPSPGLIAFLILTACAVAGDRPGPGEVAGPADALQEAAATITPGDMLDRIAFLASDELAGRATPSPGLERAAEYLAGEFGRLGLEPAGDGGTFVQRYPLPGGAGAADPSAAPNVVAILRGADPALRDTYVVFSAHMDHVGNGTPDATGDSIYNGADDDASGTAALVEVAEAFASLPEAPARSLLFLAVSGEERGLLGSRWFADHPPVPPDRLVADLNVDMISRNASDSIVLIGQEYSSLGPLVRTIADERSELGLAVLSDPWPEEGFFFRSDHYSFASKGIPAIFFFAGTHEDYHRPSDEVEKIDPEKAARVARLIFYTAAGIAGDPDPPEWTPEGLEAIGR